MKRGNRRRKLTGLAAAFVSILMTMFAVPAIPVRAEGTADFRVQASEVQEDGTIRVSVYLVKISNMGGIEAQLTYEPEKLTYVSSGLGQGFLDGYGTTHYDAETSTIQCVAVFTDAKNVQGEILHAVFRPNNVESYQPEFKIVNLVDSSVELNSIPYTISYQQADGTWTDTQDKSEKKADSAVIQQAREQYASEADKEGLANGYPEDETAEDLVTQSGEAGTENNENGEKDNAGKDAAGNTPENGTGDEKEAEQLLGDSEGNSGENGAQGEKQKKEEERPVIIAVILGLVVIAVITAGCILARRKKNGK